MARPPAPLKKSAAFKPLTAKKSRRRKVSLSDVSAFSPPRSSFAPIAPSSSPALLATFTSPVAAAAASRSASPSSVAAVFGLVSVPFELRPPKFVASRSVSGAVAAACHPASAHVAPTAANGARTELHRRPGDEPAHDGPERGTREDGGLLAPQHFRAIGSMAQIGERRLRPGRVRRAPRARDEPPEEELR